MTASTMPPPPSQLTPQKKKLLIIGVGAVVAAIVIGIVVKNATKPEAAPTTVEHSTPWLEDGVIRYPTTFATREKITFAPAEETMLTPNLYVTGEVTWDARRVAAIGARIEGRLRTVLKVDGEDVKAGEVIAELESVELGKAQAEVLKVRAREQVAKLDAERERKLADARVSAERDAQFAQANLEALTAERVAAEKAVEALGGTVNGEIGIMKLKSPIAGRIVEMKTMRGQTVGPTDTVATVADQQQVWVELTVFERDVPGVNEGDKVEIRLPADRQHSYEGTVVHVSEAIDREKRAGTARVQLENPDGRLRSGLSVTAVIHTSGPRDTRLTIPKSAVTRIDGKPTVFVEAGNEAVEPRNIKLGPEDTEDVAVLEGLKAGEKVVTSGVLALKAEVFR